MAEMFLIGWCIADGDDYQVKYDSLTDHLDSIGGYDTGATSSYVVPSSMTATEFCKSLRRAAKLDDGDALIVAAIDNLPVGSGDVNPQVVKRVV